MSPPRAVALGLPAWVLVPAAGVLLLQWLLLALYGLPATHDGFWHLNWTESANHALWREGSWPRWYAEAWGGLGNPSFTYYPPLLRWLSLPFGWLDGPASLPLRGAIGLLLLGQLLAAHAFLRRLPLQSGVHALLLVLALLQPYWLTNVWIRGAWPEALGMVALWPLAGGLLAALRDEARAAYTHSSLGAAVLLLANNPMTLLVAYAAGLAGLLLLAVGAGRRLLPLAAGLGTGAALAACSLLPALLDQDAIRLATGDALLAHEWPLGDPAATPLARAFAPLWCWLAAVALLIAFCLRQHAGASRGLLVALLGMLLLALLLMLPASAALYAQLPQLGRIQFPWRWLGIAGSVALIALAMLASGSPRWRNGVLGLAALGVLCAIPPLAGLQFPTAAQQRLDSLFACEREAPTCADYAAHGALADRFAGLRFAGQHAQHQGPWLHDDGRVWRYEVYDYMPRGILVETWERAPRRGVAMPPFILQPGLRAAPASALVVLGERRAGQRWTLDIRLHADADLVLERLRFRGAELRVRPLAGGAWQTPLTDPNSLFHRLALPAGEYRLVWRYVGTPAERSGALISVLTLLALLCAWLWQRWRPLHRRR